MNLTGTMRATADRLLNKYSRLDKRDQYSWITQDVKQMGLNYAHFTDIMAYVSSILWPQHETKKGGTNVKQEQKG
jgi:hypothetical protein